MPVLKPVEFDAPVRIRDGVGNGYREGRVGRIVGQTMDKKAFRVLWPNNSTSRMVLRRQVEVYIDGKWREAPDVDGQ